MRYEVEIRVPLRFTVEVSPRCSLLPSQNRPARFREILFNLPHFGTGLGQRAKLGNSKRVAHEKYVLLFGRRALGSGREQRQGTRRGHSNILNPKVALRAGHDQRLEIKAIEAGIRQEDHAGTRRNQLLCGFHQ